MAERNYTVLEIDDLRKACERRWLYGTTRTRDFIESRAYTPTEKDVGVEQLVRTYMAAGILAADIYEADAAKATRG